MLRSLLLLVVMSIAAAPAAAQSKLVGTVEELRTRADQYFKEERYDEARDTYLQIRGTFDKDALLHRNLGTAYLRGSKPNVREAIRYWTISWTIDGSEDLRRETAKAYFGLGQWQQGTRVLTDLATEHPQHPEHWQEAAAAAEQAKQYGPAISWYGRYLARRPADTTARLTRARLLGWEKRFDEALQEYAMVLKTAPRNLEARLASAQLLAWQGVFADSIERYDAILTDHPANVDALRGKAFALLWMGRADEAKPLFEQVLQRRRSDVDARKALADIAQIETARAVAPPVDPLDEIRAAIDTSVQGGDLARAQTQIDEGLTRFPGEMSLRRRLAQWHLTSNDVAAAIDVLNALRREHPQNVDVLRELAWAEMRANDLEAASATLTALVAAAPGDRAARVDLARVLSWSRRFDEAAGGYRAVLAVDPANLESRVGLAQLDAWQGRYGAALEQFDAILADVPDQREALIGRAQALYWVGRKDEGLAALAALAARFPADREIASLAESLRAAAPAETERPADPASRRGEYEAALAANPNDAEALSALGDLESSAGQYPPAIRLYQRALSVRADDAATRLALARALSQTRAYGDAARAYEAVLTAQPDNRDARLELARILSWDGRYDASLRVYAAAIERKPDDKDALVERARVLSWKGDLDRAIQLFTELEAKYPGDRDVLLGKGQSLQWAGRAIEAERILAPLRGAYPADRDVRVALAGTQLALGRSDLAWQEIEAAGGRRSDSADVQLMRSLVLRQIRPVLIVGYSPSLDSDDLRIEPWTATLYFSAVPRVRSYVRASYTPSDIPSVGHAEGRSTVIGSTIQLAPKALLRAEGGVDLTRQHDPEAIGRLGTTLLPSRRVRIELDAERQFLDYLPGAVQHQISRDAARTAVDYRPFGRWLIRGDYTYARFSDSNESQGVSVTSSVAFSSRERLMLEAGYLYTLNKFADDPGNGYYAPSKIQRHASLLNFAMRPARWIGWAFAGTLGVEQAITDPFRIDGTARVSLDLSPTPALKWIAGYGYFRVASLSRSGAYLTHSVFSSVEVRF